jgi:hypothetical protein
MNTNTKKQTEMPWTTAAKLARKILIEALASEVWNRARWYKRAIALRKEFKDHGIEIGDYNGETYDDLGRCPDCYKKGEQMSYWAVCREHNVRWGLNNGQLEKHQPQPLDPEQKKFLGSLSEVSPLNEPPHWFDDLFDSLRFPFEMAFINAVMDHEWADHIMSKAERKKFYEIRKKEGRKINPETAEVMRICIGSTDPYGLFPERPYDSFGRENFYRNPGSDIWVFEGDVPVAIREAIWKKRATKDAAENAELPAENRDDALDLLDADIPF